MGLNSTFKRSECRGFRPYKIIVNGVKKYAFIANKNLSLKRIFKIEAEFSDDELCFLTTDRKFYTHTYSTDAANVYEVGGRGRRMLLFVDSVEKFYKVEVISAEIKSDPSAKAMVLGDVVQVIPYKAAGRK